jgi:RecQ zinc-binding
MDDYCTQPGCRRQRLLKHFGERSTDPAVVCQKTCDYCCNPTKVNNMAQVAHVSYKPFPLNGSRNDWNGQWDQPHGESECDGGDDYTSLHTAGGLKLVGAPDDFDDGELVDTGRRSSKASTDHVLSHLEVSPNTFTCWCVLLAHCMTFVQCAFVLKRLEAKELARVATTKSEVVTKSTSFKIPAHLRAMLPDPLAGFQTASGTSISHAASKGESNSAEIKSRLANIEAERKALLEKQAKIRGER